MQFSRKEVTKIKNSIVPCLKIHYMIEH
uniref:Uncharacterized protein n=1 Tax=Arundo donax TaxID=35708 RepID=A0A0A9B881_ARUDO